jgi:hypothetical protein
VPWFVVLVMVIPAALNVYVSSTGKALVMNYSLMGYRLFLFIVLLVAVSAPELVSRDLRHHTLPLYFSRPLRRIDYPLAKLLALITAVLMVTMLPVLITYVGQIASATSGHQMWLDSRQAFPGVFVSVMESVVFSVLALLLAASTGRRVIATGLIAIFFLVTMAISHVMSDALGKSWSNHTASCTLPVLTGQQAQNFNGPTMPVLPPGSNPGGGGPGQISQGGGIVIGPDTPQIAQLCPGLSFNLDNIGTATGTPDASKAGYYDVTIGYQAPVYNTIAKAGGLVNPTNLVEGARIWVFNATDSDLPDPSPLGPLYAVEIALVAVLGTGGLFLRYRKVSVS